MITQVDIKFDVLPIKTFLYNLRSLISNLQAIFFYHIRVLHNFSIKVFIKYSKILIWHSTAIDRFMFIKLVTALLLIVYCLLSYLI